MIASNNIGGSFFILCVMKLSVRTNSQISFSSSAVGLQIHHVPQHTLANPQHISRPNRPCLFVVMTLKQNPWNDDHTVGLEDPSPLIIPAIIHPSAQFQTVQ